MEHEINLDDATQWVTYKDFAEELSQVLKKWTLRELMRKRDTNGLTEAGVVCKPGKNLLIHRAGFGRWMRRQQ